MPPVKTVSARAHTRPLTIIAQDPSVRGEKGVLTTQIDVPAERLGPGPWGYRVQVVDYDSTRGAFYEPLRYENEAGYTDPFAEAAARHDDEALLGNPQFHAQNVYAIVMRILARFEFALGRRVSWSFPTHQLKAVPHAFAEANAFYSKRDEALLFGYFPGRSGTVFSSLSHDVVAHETTHALLDGLRERYTDPSSPDQAAFHEGFADVVALLSVFALRDVVDAALTVSGATKAKTIGGRRVLSRKAVTPDALKDSLLLGLAEQMGEEMSSVRGRPLRRSVAIPPGRDYRDDPEFAEPHRRGELLVAVMMTAFLRVLDERLKALDAGNSGWLDRERVIEEAAKAADHLLTISVRALDYCMPVHLEFADFLSAVLTADAEVFANDSPFHYRDHLRQSFADYGFRPASASKTGEPGTWKPIGEEIGGNAVPLDYQRTHFRSLQTDRDEMFRFVWDNRRHLLIREDVYTRVLSVRPCLRIGPDGFPLHETVAEYVQIAEVEARELQRFDVKRPAAMPDDARVWLYGGGTLIFDDYGRLKFHIHNRIDDGERQSARIEYLWNHGFFREKRTEAERSFRFAQLHRLRSIAGDRVLPEEWH